MPFRPRDLATVSTDLPDVEIFFHGQLLLRSEDEVTCEVAVNPLATNHILTVEARTKIVGRPDPIIRMRHVGPLNFRQGEGMLIEVSPAVGSPAAFNCRTFNPINYVSGEVPPRNDDFRWILNLEGPQFHRRELNVPIFTSHHIIRLRNGEYFFRTARRADARLSHKRRGGEMDEVTFRRIGTIASASVFLAPNQSVVLRWRSPAKDGDHVVTLTKAGNTTHEIFINNAPLFIDPPVQGEDEQEFPQFDELIECYKVIPGIGSILTDERFRLVPVLAPRPREDEAGSPDIPCQVMRLDGPTND
jgi:hypothetical protein